MLRTTRTRAALSLLVLASLTLPTSPISATCGGGGGGGMGGASPRGGSGPTPEVYHVPWKVIGAADAVPEGDLAVLWFPKSADDARRSSLLGSRGLTMASGRCVAMAIITTDNAAVHDKYKVADGASVLVLAGGDGAEIGRMEPQGGPFDVDMAEQLVNAEIDKREEAAKTALEEAKDKASSKDADGAAALYTQVWKQKCLLPGPAQKASKGLKKLGRPVESASLWQGPTPTRDKAKVAEILRLMSAGLAAEQDDRLLDAKKDYEQARFIDPADPVPVRFLGELMRHHIGDWDAARALFEQVLSMPADPVSRAVALHGLGKMTIHEGKFADGLALFQKSLDAYPLALTYRNLAVYWNSEKDHVKAHDYVAKALALEPDDAYNLIFAATYYVELGRPDEAREVALKYDSVLPASYNLAAIHAQLGDTDRALELLRRHFNVYEQFEAVRMKEMKEARDDVAFAALHADPVFVDMTALAERDRWAKGRMNR